MTIQINPPAGLQGRILEAAMEASGYTDVSAALGENGLAISARKNGEWIDDTELPTLQPIIDQALADSETARTRLTQLQQRMAPIRVKLRAGEDLTLTEISWALRYLFRSIGAED